MIGLTDWYIFIIINSGNIKGLLSPTCMGGEGSGYFDKY